MTASAKLDVVDLALRATEAYNRPDLGARLTQTRRRLLDPRVRVLAAEVERILAGAHEFTELRLLAELRSRAVRFPAEVMVEAERLLGADGGGPAARLGLDADRGPDELRGAALDAHGRWQRRAESPLSDRATADATRTVVRSCEGLLAQLSRQADRRARLEGG